MSGAQRHTALPWREPGGGVPRRAEPPPARCLISQDAEQWWQADRSSSSSGPAESSGGLRSGVPTSPALPAELDALAPQEVGLGRTVAAPETTVSGGGEGWFCAVPRAALSPAVRADSLGFLCQGVRSAGGPSKVWRLRGVWILGGANKPRPLAWGLRAPVSEP